MMTDFLAARYAADDVIFWLLDMYLMMSDILAARYVADDVSATDTTNWWSCKKKINGSATNIAKAPSTNDYKK